MVRAFCSAGHFAVKSSYVWLGSLTGEDHAACSKERLSDCPPPCFTSHKSDFAESLGSMDDSEAEE